MMLNPIEGDALWTVRNTLMHSFGLYDQKTSQRVIATDHCRISRQHSASPVRIDPGTGRWMLCVEHLFRAFIEGVSAYLAHLRSSPADLQPKFASMFPHYGWMLITP